MKTTLNEPRRFWFSLLAFSAVFAASIFASTSLLVGTGESLGRVTLVPVVLVIGWAYTIIRLNRARQTIQTRPRHVKLDRDAPNVREWTCLSCSEQVDEHLDVCWHCGASRLGDADPDFKPAVVFHPQCESCGYLLLGVLEDRCPECGKPFDRSKVDTPQTLPRAD